MSKIISTALFVSCAAAQMTTSAWMAAPGSDDVSYAASVIGVENDRTTMDLAASGVPGADSVVQTVTLQGNTYYAFNAMAEVEGVTATVAGECSRANTDATDATCIMSTMGLDAALSSVCASAGAGGDLCSGGALDTATTDVLPSGYFGMVEVVVTAGESLLPSATAAGTPSAGSASATASSSNASNSAKSSASNSAKPSASNSQKPSGSGANQSGASKTSEPTAQSTNAAPLMTMVPALAGIGAAAAFFL
jgi:hypothetical protein